MARMVNAIAKNLLAGAIDADGLSAAKPHKVPRSANRHPAMQRRFSRSLTGGTS